MIIHSTSEQIKRKQSLDKDFNVTGTFNLSKRSRAQKISIKLYKDIQKEKKFMNEGTK